MVFDGRWIIYSSHFGGSRHSGLMVSALDSASSGSASSPGRGNCVVFLGKNVTLTVPLSDQVYIGQTISFLISLKRTVNFRNQRLWRQFCRLYNMSRSRVIMSRSRVIMSRSRAVMSSSSALCCLPSVKKQKHDFHFFRSMYNKTIVTFGLCNIQNNQGRGRGYEQKLSRMITLTETLIILDITKTSSNNCL